MRDKRIVQEMALHENTNKNLENVLIFFLMFSIREPVKQKKTNQIHKKGCALPIKNIHFWKAQISFQKSP